jgi:hypothetical protein
MTMRIDLNRVKAVIGSGSVPCTGQDGGLWGALEWCVAGVGTALAAVGALVL